MDANFKLLIYQILISGRLYFESHSINNFIEIFNWILNLKRQKNKKLVKKERETI